MANKKETGTQGRSWLKRQIRDSFQLRSGSYYGLMRQLSPEDALSIDDILTILKEAGLPYKPFTKHFNSYLIAAKKAQAELKQAELIKLTAISPHDAMLLYKTELELQQDGIQTDPACIYTLALLIERAAVTETRIKKYLPLAQVELPPLNKNRWQDVSDEFSGKY